MHLFAPSNQSICSTVHAAAKKKGLDAASQEGVALAVAVTLDRLATVPVQLLLVAQQARQKEI